MTLKCKLLTCLFVDLVNVFEVFLPQLLRYPNPADPLNGDAASLLLRSPDNFKTRVREYIKKYSSEEFYLNDVEVEEQELDPEQVDSELMEVSNFGSNNIDEASIPVEEITKSMNEEIDPPTIMLTNNDNDSQMEVQNPTEDVDNKPYYISAYHGTNAFIQHIATNTQLNYNWVLLEEEIKYFQNDTNLFELIMDDLSSDFEDFLSESTENQYIPEINTEIE